MKVVAAILAGGQSTRMGRDKANLPSVLDAETTMLRRMTDLAVAVFERVFVVGRPRPDTGGFSLNAVTFLPDESPNLGPMGGLATILRFLAVQNRDTSVALLACDLPLLSVASLEWLAGQSLERDGAVVQNGGQIEPLFAIYTPECLPLLEAQLASGRRSLQKLIAIGEFAVSVAPPEIAETLVNVNTEDELTKVQSRLRSGGK